MSALLERMFVSFEEFVATRICSYSQTKYLRQNECCYHGYFLTEF